MAEMRRLLLILMAVLLPGPVGAEDLMYRDSRGRYRQLTVDRAGALPERIAFSVPDDPRPGALGRGVLVRLARPAPTPDPSIASRTGLASPVRLDREGSLWLYRSDGPLHSLTAAGEAALQPGVSWALPDFEIPVDLCSVPDDPWFHRQWYLDQPNGAHVNALEAWEQTTGSPEAVVAVVDTGLDSGHPDFEPGRIMPGRDTWHGTADPSPGDQPWDGHGTCCAGLIGATRGNGEGISGLCPGCSLLPVRFMDGKVDITNYRTTLARGYQAIRWAVDNGAWVISNSWEVGPAWIDDIDLEPFHQAIRDAQALGRGGLGSVVVFAAGNRGIELDPRSLAAQPGVVSVGATGPDDIVEEYSNRGPGLSLVAPGGPSGYDSPGERLFTTDVRGDGGFSRDGRYWMSSAPSPYDEPDPTGDYTAWFNGTSAAAPLVAAAAGLVLSADPDLTADDVTRILTSTADPIGPLASDPDRHDERYGHGRLNAGRAARTARYGVDREDGAACLEDASCAGGVCRRGDALTPGVCTRRCSADGDCRPGAVCGSDRLCSVPPPDGDGGDGDGDGVAPVDGDEDTDQEVATETEGEGPADRDRDIDPDATDGDGPDGDAGDRGGCGGAGSVPAPWPPLLLLLLVVLRTRGRAGGNLLLLLLSGAPCLAAGCGGGSPDGQPECESGAWECSSDGYTLRRCNPGGWETVECMREQGRLCEAGACVDPWRYGSPVWSVCPGEPLAAPGTLAAKAAYFEEVMLRLHLHPELKWTMAVTLPCRPVACGPAETPPCEDCSVPAIPEEQATWRDVVQWHSGENDGLWNAHYIVAEAFRHAATGDPESLSNLRTLLDGMRIRMAVTGVPGVFTRQYVPPGIAGLHCPTDDAEYRRDPQKDDNRWVQVRDDGCVWFVDDTTGRWTRSGHCGLDSFSGYCWLDNVSKDEYAGHMAAIGAVGLLVDDPELRGAAVELCRQVARHLIDNRLAIVDWDGRVTEHGRFWAIAFDDYPGFNAAMALGYLATCAGLTGDPEIGRWHRECLLQQAGEWDCLQREFEVPKAYTDYLGSPGLYIGSEGCRSNYNNISMHLHSLFNLILFEREPALRELYQRSLEVDVFRAPGQPRAVQFHNNAAYDFLFAALKRLGPGSDGPASGAVENGVCMLRQFPNRKGPTTVQCPPEKCRPYCKNRFDRDVGDYPRQVAERCMDRRFIWWGDPYSLDECRAEPRVVVPAADYLMAYWMGRYFGFITGEM